MKLHEAMTLWEGAARENGVRLIGMHVARDVWDKLVKEFPEFRAKDDERLDMPATATYALGFQFHVLDRLPEGCVVPMFSSSIFAVPPLRMGAE